MDDANTSFFKYSPLDLERSSIRLIRLRKDDGDPTQCELFQAWLDQADDLMDFEALSYTWGSPDKLRKIVVNGYTMTITLNLYFALLHLRLPDKDRILWIDAICIDQEDKKERGHQVRHMGFIYRKAERVIFWLGLGAPETDFIMDCMKRMEKATIQYNYCEWESEDKRWKPLWESTLAASDSDIGTGRIGECLKELLSRSWFRRVWILQEVANARTAVLICGNRTVSARILALMPFLLQMGTDPHCRAVLDIFPGLSRESSWWSHGKRDLRMLLTKFSQAEASDPRDRIYALYGIASDTCNSDVFTADYGKSTDTVIYETIIHLLGIPEVHYPKEYVPLSTTRQFFAHLRDISYILFESALEMKDEAIVRSLVQHLNINDVCLIARNGMTMLHLAAVRDKTTMVALLLQKDIDLINTRDGGGRTALSWAAGNGRPDLVRLLLERDNIDVNAKDYEGMTPLSHALKSNHREVLELLHQRDDLDTKIWGLKRRDSCVTLGYEAHVNFLEAHYVAPGYQYPTPCSSVDQMDGWSPRPRISDGYYIL